MGPLVVKSIQLGRDFGDSVEVTAGLAPQDRVIASPPETLQDGDVVQTVAAPRMTYLLDVRYERFRSTHRCSGGLSMMAFARH